MKNLCKNRWFGSILCCILLTPSFFINNGVTHDWGGDFALYIRQAMNIVEGVPQTDNGYIYNPACPGLSTKTYPVGFPMILAPVYAVSGNNMAAFIDYMAIIAILFALTVYLLLSGSAGVIPALLVAVGIAYHPSILEFKREVMSDLPFALLILAALMLAEKKKWWLLLPILILASVTRTAGISLFIALGLWGIYQWYRTDRTLLENIKTDRSLVVLLLGILGYLALNHLVFETDSETGYRSVFGRYPIVDVVSGNVKFYSEFLRSFLYNEYGFQWFGALGTGLFVLLSVVGWLRKSFKELGLAEIWVPIYLGLLLIYPYRGAGLRFMLPLLPLGFFYLLYGIKSSTSWMKYGILSLALVPFLINAPKAIAFAENWPEFIFGPQSELTVEMFEFVQKETPANATFLFIKPRVLALYTHRSALSNERYQEVESIKRQLDSMHVSYLLHAKQIANPGLESLLATYPELTELVFENVEFELYRYGKP